MWTKTPDEPSQEAAHHHAPALQHCKILDDYGNLALVEVTTRRKLYSWVTCRKDQRTILSIGSR
jgi:hypothetical protein